MAVQSSITEYFNSRKRPVLDDVKKIGQPSKKVMILENVKDDVSNCREFSSCTEELLDKVQSTVRRKLIYVDKKTETDDHKGKVCSELVNKNKKNKGNKLASRSKSDGTKQLDIRKTFSVLNRPTCNSSNTENSISDVKSSVEKKHISTDVYITPTKSDTSDMVVLSPVKEGPSVLHEKEIHNQNKEVASCVFPVQADLEDSSEKYVGNKANEKVHFCSLPESKNNENITRPTEKASSKKELNIEEIRFKLKKSSRFGDLKARLNKLSDGLSKLENLREKKIIPKIPTIKKFDTISFDVLTSPSKTPTKITSGMSPAKLREAVFKSPGGKVNMEPVYVSPRKLFDMQPEPNPLTSPTKPPAFKRYQALVTEGRSALTLPFKYRSLAEIFRGIETVVSMMHNRRETVTFTKLKSAVQELLRRNLYEKHLGQIKTVFNDAFEFSYEKVPSAGKHVPDRYELVIKPFLKKSNTKTSDDTSSSEINPIKLEMSPDVLLERRRVFYNCLLDKTKLYHEEFLLSRDPPIHVNRDSITRWHPEFDVDDVPDIDPVSLPTPPNVQKVATAKDVLERARNLFGTNPRLDSAMQRLSEQNNEANSAPIVSTTTNTGPAVAALTNALKGIPKSLLEKVRAKQAAKALEVMTRSPAQAKEAVQLTRLPEIARIVRNIFISEKKSVLTRELVIKKLADSYRENLSSSELSVHLDLLQEKSPEWLSFCTLRKTNFVKFVKDADMLRIMTRLESIASENSY